MHTGYDNFWMYQNNRHEPVLSLPKNDNHSHAVLTDTYKQVLNGGSPNNFNSCTMPQNNVARSHHSNQQRITGSQYVWPSSGYSLPFRSSNTNNFHSQESYPNQCNNLSYSSQNYQVQQNYDSRYLRNRNSDFPYVSNSTNSDNYSHPAKIQSNENTNTPVARIRVKDVFTLNNNSLFGNSSFQTNQREQSECPLNYAITHNLTSCDSKMPSEYVDYEKINLLESINPPSHYEHKVAEQLHSSDQEKFLHYSGSFCQSSNQPSSKSEFQLSVSKEKNFSLDTMKTNSLTEQLKNTAGIQEAERNYNDLQHGSKRIKVKPKRNLIELRNLDNSETTDFCDSSEKFNESHCCSLLAGNDIMNNASATIRVTQSQAQLQENLSNIEKVNSLNHDSLIGKLRKWRKSGQCFASNPDSPSQNQINGQEHSTIKITIPHIGQSSFLQLDSRSVEGTCNISSICVLESKNQMSQTLKTKIPIFKQINTEENDVVTQINQNNSINNTAPLSNSQLVHSNSPSKTQSDHACFTASISPSKTLESVNQGLHQEKVGCAVGEVVFKDRENPNVLLNTGGCSENILENFSLKNFNKNKEISSEISSCSSITTLNSVVIKQETSGIGNSHEQCNPIEQVCDQIIKMEKNPEDSLLHVEKTELPYCGNVNPLEKIQLLEANCSENIDFNDEDGEKFSISSKDHISEIVSSCALNNTDNCIQEFDVPKDTTDGEKGTNFANSNIDSPKEEIIKVPITIKNYTSKINRDKLDLLIEFLNKEEDTIEKANTPEESTPDHSLCLKKTDMNNKMKKKIEPSRNRRKLSKACIVKNKNNSREMISLLSHKIAQVEIFKCSSKTSPNVETNNNPDKSDEKAAGNIANTKKSDEKGDSSESRPVTDKLEEARTSSEGNRLMKDKGFDLSEKHAEINKPLQTFQTQKDLSKFDTNDVNVSGNKKCQGTSEESSPGKECDIREEQNIINTMRAFQNFKTHFCMSCDLISGVDSFWINVVSGELRCLNCFKKMLLKAEDSVLKLKADDPDNNNDSETCLVQEGKPKQASENGEENKAKTGCENDLESKAKLLDFTEFHCGQKKVNQKLKESIKQELSRQRNETIKEKIINKSNDEQSFISDLRRTEITDCSNSSKSRIESRENNASLLEKNYEKQKESKLSESKNKLKEDVSRKVKVCEGIKKQEMKELQEKSRKKSFTKGDEVVKIQSPELRVSSIGSKKNCSATEILPNYTNTLEGKNTLTKNVNPVFNSVESYREELLSEGSEKKIISKVSHITTENVKQLSKECKKHESVDQLEKSNRKAVLKQEGVWEEFIKKEKKMAKNLQNQIRKRNNSVEEVICEKVQILNERSKKELQVIESSDKSIKKTCSIETCACHKTQNLENSMKINSRRDSSDKLKVQSPLKETCYDYKTKILGHTKSKDTHLAHEVKKKSGCSNNSVEKHKKVELEQSRKRRNSEDYSIQKVRIIEEQTKKEIKPMTHLSERAKIMTKEYSGYYESKKLESEKQNLRDSGEKLRKSNFSKADYVTFGKHLKKDEKQVSDSSDNWNSKGDLALGKMKNSENSKPEGIDSTGLSRRRSKEERTSVISKEHSKNEIKNIVGSADKLRNFTLKEINDLSKAQITKTTKKEIKDGSLAPKVKEWEKTEEQEKKHFCGKIPKRPYTGSDKNLNEAIKSPNNYKLKNISDAGIIKAQSTRVRSESPNRKLNRESIKSGRAMANKKEGIDEMEVNKKEAFFKMGNPKDKKELGNDANQKKGPGQTKGSKSQDRKGKAFGCYEGTKEDVHLSECRQNSSRNEKLESATLLAKLIKKTKKLSWSLLKEQ